MRLKSLQMLFIAIFEQVRRVLTPSNMLKLGAGASTEVPRRGTKSPAHLLDEEAILSRRCMSIPKNTDH